MTNGGVGNGRMGTRGGGHGTVVIGVKGTPPRQCCDSDRSCDVGVM